MGKKFGKLMKGVAARMSSLSQEEIAQLEQQGHFDFEYEGQAVSVEAADVEIISEDIPGWLVSNEGNLTVALEVEISEPLRQEGIARELINRIQNLRKESGLEITDHISVVVSPNEKTDAAVHAFSDYICSQVLANKLEVADNDGSEAEIDELKLNILIQKD